MGNLGITEAKSLYSGKKVLVTGDTGFKGSWLCLWLKLLGAEVLGIGLPPERREDHFVVTRLGKSIKHANCDIRDYAKLQKTVDGFGPEFMFHLAAQALVRPSYDMPKLTFDTNVGGSVNILECARNSDSLRSVVYVTSDKCYKNKEWIWGYRENDELGGHDPYSASKSAAEIIFSSYSDSFFSQRPSIGIASVRAGNVIGGGDWAADRIVPDCIRALMKDEPVVLRNPGATRPWQHVLEPLSGYLLLAGRLYHEPGKYSGSWNFGPDSRSIKPVEALAGEIIKAWGYGRLKKEGKKSGLHEATLLHLNIDKAIYNLDWHPRWDFERAVYETASWYKKVLNGEPAAEISQNQIINYMEENP